MSICAQPAEMRDMAVYVGRNAASVRIPRMEEESDYFLMEEQLLSALGGRPAAAWIFDLSEHADGLTLVLAGVLSGLCEEVRRQGHTVECVGLRKPCAKCGTRRG